MKLYFKVAEMRLFHFARSDIVNNKKEVFT